MVHLQLPVATVDTNFGDPQHLLTKLKANIRRPAQLGMKQQADNHVTDVVFEQGDWVFLKLQPYRQRLIYSRAGLKLAKRFYGPFKSWVISEKRCIAYNCSTIEKSIMFFMFLSFDSAKAIP